ncbi:DUF6779 domain-containing protein [Corynebacterium sp. 335C]
MTHPDEQHRGYGVRDDRTGDDAEWSVGDDYDYGYGDDDAQAPAPAESDADDAAPSGSGDDDPADRAGVILLAVLVVLALLASIIMLFTSSATWMKIAVLAGLWAAVIGAVLTTRYRRKLAAERGRFAELERLHRAELAKEEATHREQELILEQNYLESLDAERDETLQQLRAEIAALREQLADLTGEAPDERVALRARAERLRELDSAGRGTSGSPLRDPGSFDRPEPRAQSHRAAATADGTVGAHTQHGPHGVRGRRDAEARADEPVDVPEVNTGSFRAVRWEPSERGPEPERRTGSHRAPEGAAAQEPQRAAETPKQQPKPAPKKPEPQPAAQPEPKKTGPQAAAQTKRQAQPETPAAQPEREDATAEMPVQQAPARGGRRRAADGAPGWTAAHRADSTDVMEPIRDEEPSRGRHGAPQPETAAEPRRERRDDAATPSRPAADDAAPSGRRSRDPHGRRRAEEHADGLTVAELLAQMRKNS